MRCRDLSSSIRAAGRRSDELSRGVGEAGCTLASSTTQEENGDGFICGYVAWKAVPGGRRPVCLNGRCPWRHTHPGGGDGSAVLD